MTWQLTVYAVPTLFAALGGAVLSLYTGGIVRRRGREPTLVVFLGITVAVTIWTGFSALKLLSADPPTKLAFYRLLHVGAAALPPLFFLFAASYTGRDRWLRGDVVAAVFLVPAVFVGLLFLNPGNIVIDGIRVSQGELVTLRVGDGPGFMFFIIDSALLIVGSLGLVAYETIRVGRSYYPQAALMGIGSLVPVLFVALNMSNVPPFGTGLNLVPTSGIVSALALGVAVYRYRLFDLPPLAYTTAMRYSPDGLFVLDSRGRIVHANPSGKRVLATVDAAVGDSIEDFVPDFDPETADDSVFEVHIGDGSPTHFRALVEPLERGGRQVGRVVLLRDVTRQQQREATLQRQTEQLDAFASTVSHDLRNPLTVAQGYLQLAKESSDSDGLDKIEAAHDRMAEIIEDVLTLSQQGKQIDDTEPVFLEPLVTESWNNVPTDGATLSVAGDATIEADETMLQHVFGNLFRNAVEHGSPGNRTESDNAIEHDGPSVSVRVGALADGFYVEDDGPGIPSDQREAVLEAGYTTTEGGTGYGLQIVDSIVDAHGWDLSVMDGTDGGARFEITGVEVTENTPA